MSQQIIIVYPNCSKGGITSVIRGRAAASPETQFHFVATRDKGGREAFQDLPNVQVHIVSTSKLASWLNYALATQDIDELAIFSTPSIVDELKVPSTCRLVYEFHSSNTAIIDNELKNFDTNKPAEFRCPTQTLANAIQRIAEPSVTKRLNVTPNLVDTRYFNRTDRDQLQFSFTRTPLVWVGRMDKNKGLKLALRSLAQLPDKYALHAILSLTDSPTGAADILGEAHSLGVENRLHLYQNLTQQFVADFFRSAAQSNGALLSTSLNESYGYVFHEATATGLPIFTFDLPVLSEFPHVMQNAATVPPGDVLELARVTKKGEIGAKSNPKNSVCQPWVAPRWHSFMEQRVRGKEADVPWFLLNKLQAFKFFEDHGLPAAKILRVFNTPDEIDLSGLEHTFVLKPTSQSSTKGVMVLEPKQDGSFYESLKQKTLTTEDIKAQQAVLFAETKSSSKKLIIEEKISDIEDYPIPRDFKAYAFAGEIALIQEINRNTRPSTTSWFDGDFKPLPEGVVSNNPKYIQEGPSHKPPFASEIIKLAKKTSEAIPTPFARIDMYLTKHGPILGEVTLTPGGTYHGLHYTLSETQQRIMGRMWENAAHRIKAREYST